jgi:hypothetical protein
MTPCKLQNTMLQSQIMMLMGVGVVAAAVSIYTVQNTVAMLAGATGTFSNALAAIGLFNVEVVSSGSVVAAGSEPAVALLMGALAFVSVIPALTGPMDVINRARQGDPFAGERGGL